MVGDEPLRLNSEPVPPDAMPLADRRSCGARCGGEGVAGQFVRRLCTAAAAVRRCVSSLHRGADRRRIGRNSLSGWSHTTDFMRRRTFCGLRCVRCRAAGCRRMISCCRRISCSGMARNRSRSSLPCARRSDSARCWRLVSRLAASSPASSRGSMQNCRVSSCASGKLRRCRPVRSGARYHPHLSLRAQRSNLGQSEHSDRDCFVATLLQ